MRTITGLETCIRLGLFRIEMDKKDKVNSEETLKTITEILTACKEKYCR